MGTYYALVNLTKKQRYEPANKAIKYGNFVWFAEEVVLLLLGPWVGDEVRMAGDWDDRLWGDTFNWPPPVWPLYSSPDGDKTSLNLDRNGVQKLMAQFVRALGPEAVSVALDAAIQDASKDPEPLVPNAHAVELQRLEAEICRLNVLLDEFQGGE